MPLHFPSELRGLRAATAPLLYLALRFSSVGHNAIAAIEGKERSNGVAPVNR
jgi:hypothetical protein